MKIKKLLLILLAIPFLIGGCSNNTHNLENATIYTTIYPIKYIVNYLYKDSGKIESIYPDGTNIKEYELSEKQIDNYSSGDLFVYVGLGEEKNIAKSFINKNKDLLIIDATYGLSSDNIEELWLAPNNFLMLVKNIKSSLNDYLDNTLKEDEVNKYYDELYKEVSWIDAELRSIANEAKSNGNNTLVVSSSVFNYLENYGFNIVNLEKIEKSKSENAINDIKNKFKNTTYKNVIVLSDEVSSELVKELGETYKANIVKINNMITNSDPASDYLSIQYENLALIRDIVLK